MAATFKYHSPVKAQALADSSIPVGRRNIDWLTHNTGTVIGQITGDASYPTGGYPAGKFGFKTVGFVQFETDPQYVAVYDRVNDKVKIYTNSHTHTENLAASYTQNATTAAGNALVEIASGTNLSAVSIYFKAEGWL